MKKDYGEDPTAKILLHRSKSAEILITPTTLGASKDEHVQITI